MLALVVCKTKLGGNLVVRYQVVSIKISCILSTCFLEGVIVIFLSGLFAICATETLPKAIILAVKPVLAYVEKVLYIIL